VAGPFELLIELTRPQTIYELGTGNGLFTNWLSETFPKVFIFSYDKVRPEVPPSRDGLFFEADILGDHNWQKRLATEIENGGRTILLCDNGDKVAEMRRFAPHMKLGDVLMCHDYAKSYKWWNRNNRPWRTVEVVRRQLHWMGPEWSPFMEDIMLEVGWGCFIKIDPSWRRKR